MSTFELLTLIVSTLAIGIAIISAIYSRTQAKEAKKQTRNQTFPHLWLNGFQKNDHERTLNIDLNNDGYTANILRAVVLSNNIVQHSISFPWLLNKGENMLLYYRYIGSKTIDTDDFKIELFFEDIVGNQYKSIITIVKQKFEISTPEFIRP